MRTILILFAMFLGICSNFLLPYVRKLILEGNIEQIDLKYVVHLVISSCWEFLFGFAVYSQWQPPSGVINEVLLYILAFAFGFGGHEIQKEVEKILNAFRKRPVVPILEDTSTDTDQVTTTTGDITTPEPTKIKPEDIQI